MFLLLHPGITDPADCDRNFLQSVTSPTSTGTKGGGTVACSFQSSSERLPTAYVLRSHRRNVRSYYKFQKEKKFHSQHLEQRAWVHRGSPDRAYLAFYPTSSSAGSVTQCSEHSLRYRICTFYITLLDFLEFHCRRCSALRETHRKPYTVAAWPDRLVGGRRGGYAS